MIIEENDCVDCEICIGCSRRYPRQHHVCDNCENDGSTNWGNKNHLYIYKGGEYCNYCVHDIIGNDLLEDEDVDIDNIIDNLDEVEDND